MERDLQFGVKLGVSHIASLSNCVRLPCSKEEVEELSPAHPLLAMSSWVTNNCEDVLRLALSSGFEAVELDCDEKPLPATLRSRMKMKEAIRQYGLRIFFYSPFLDQAIGSINKTIRGNTFNTLKMCLDFLQEYTRQRRDTQNRGARRFGAFTRDWSLKRGNVGL